MQIESFNPVVPVQVEIDGYVPLIIRFIGNANWPPIYWRTGDFKHSLVEIAVDPATGAVGKITLTSIKDVSLDCQLITDFGMHSSGIPNASQTAWERDQTRIDVEAKVRGSLTGRTFTVFFGEIQTYYNLVKCGRVTFLLNSGKNLCGFQVNDLSDKEIEDLLYSISRP